MVQKINTVYEIDDVPRFIVKAVVEQQTFGLTLDGVGGNFPTNAEPDLDITALSGTTRKGYGIHMRAVLLEWTSQPPEGYNPRVRPFVPILRPIRFKQIRIGFTGTYLGQPVRVVSKIPETIGG